MERFEIIMKEPVKSLSDIPAEPPEDDPDDLEFFIWRYLHDFNRRVEIHVGAAVLEAELDPDIRMIVVHLPELAEKLEAGRKAMLGFTERGFDVYLVPEGGTVICTPHQPGRQDDPSFLCDRAQVIAEIRRFLEEIARDATARGYLTSEQQEDLIQTAG